MTILPVLGVEKQGILLASCIRWQAVKQFIFLAEAQRAPIDTFDDPIWSGGRRHLVWPLEHFKGVTSTVRYISRTLWASLFALSAILLIAGFMLTQSGSALPAMVLEQMAASATSFEKSLAPIPEEKPTEASLEQRGSPLPQTTTYYRWTDDQGHIGYSDDLPENINSFKAIVLNRQPEPAAQPRHP